MTLELGGKSANIVFADADLEKAAASAPNAVFDNAGQDCCARSRILVEAAGVRGVPRSARAAVEGSVIDDPREETRRWVRSSAAGTARP